MISRTGVHAIKAVASLAELEQGVFAGANEIAERTGAPPNYLGKLLKTLAEEGILVSQKGKNGGFRLARDPQSISLHDVMDPIEHVSRWRGCFLGRDQCSDTAPCAVHRQWGRIRDSYLQFLKQTTISDLAAHRETRPAAGEPNAG